MTRQPTDDDITALRKDGDLPRYLRDLIRPTRHTSPARGDPTTPYGPAHRPGAWPHPTQPPTSLVCQPNCPCAIHPPPT
jgi:hypothetical protein